jgi:hypothetical protein
MMDNLDTYLAMQAPSGVPADSSPALPQREVQRDREVTAKIAVEALVGTPTTEHRVLSTEYPVPSADAAEATPVDQTQAPAETETADQPGGDA